MSDQAVSEQQRLANFFEALKRPRNVQKAESFTTAQISSTETLSQAETERVDKIIKQIEELGKHFASIDALCICYHGVGRSREVVEMLKDIVGNQITADNTGIDRLAAMIPPSLSAQSEKRIIDAIGTAVSKSKNIALLIDGSDIDNDKFGTQRKVLEAIVTRTPRERIVNMKDNDAFPRLVQRFITSKN